MCKRKKQMVAIMECNVEDNGKDTLAEDEGESKDSHNYWYLRMNNYTCLLSYSNYSAPYYMISCLAVVLQQGMRCISNFRSS